MQSSYCKRTIQNSEKLNQKILDEMIKSIQQIDYGEVVVTIHNAEVVQIEKREKTRFLK